MLLGSVIIHLEHQVFSHVDLFGPTFDVIQYFGSLIWRLTLVPTPTLFFLLSLLLVEVKTSFKLLTGVVVPVFDLVPLVDPENEVGMDVGNTIGGLPRNTDTT